MQITLKRQVQVGDATIGKLTVDNGFSCYTLEDIFRPTKVAGETRIPAGTYAVKLRMVLSGKTQAYRKKYPWFSWHLELQGVPNYQNVYIHIGNKAADTEGCILLGTSWDGKSAFIGGSGVAYEPFYKVARAALESGEEVVIDVQDE